MKRYPFSVQKHAHDIEFRKNRVWCILREMDYGEIPWDEKKYDSLQYHMKELEELLDVILYTGDGRICYLTGKQIALAKECVNWASNTRAESMIEAGKYEYLKYC